MGNRARAIIIRDGVLWVGEVDDALSARVYAEHWCLHLLPTPAGWHAALAQQIEDGWVPDGPAHGNGFRRVQRLRRSLKMR